MINRIGGCIRQIYENMGCHHQGLPLEVTIFQMNYSTSNSVPSRKLSSWIIFIGNQIYTLLFIVRNLVLIPIYLRSIQVDVFGVWVAFSGAISIMAISDLGLNSLLIQRTANLYGNREYSGLGRTIVSTLITVACLSGLAFLLVWGIAPWVPGWLGIKGRDVSELILSCRLAALDGMLMLSTMGMGGVLFGLQRPTVYMAGLIVGQALGIGVTLKALWAGWGVLAIPAGMLTGTSVAFIANAVALWISAHRVLPAGTMRFDAATLKELLKSSSLLLVARLGGLFSSRSYGVIVAVVLSPSLVVVLEITRKAMITVVDLVSRLPASLLPGLSHLLGAREDDKWRPIVSLMFRFVLLLSLLGAGAVFLLNREFISLWTGEQFFGGEALSGLICLYALTQIINSASYNVIFAAGKIKVIVIAALIEAFLQISLSIGLGYAWGLKGIALAALMATAASLLIYGGCAVNLLNLQIFRRDTLIKGLGIVSLGLIPFILGLPIIKMWPVKGWWHMGTFAVGYILVGGVLILALDSKTRSMLALIWPFGPQARFALSPKTVNRSLGE